MTLTSASLLLAIIILAHDPSTPPRAEPPSPSHGRIPTYTFTQNDDETHVHAMIHGDDPRATAAAPRTSPRAPAPVVERRLVPACPGNSATNAAEALCVGATQVCAATGQQGISYWLFTRPADGTAGWQLAAQQCLQPAEVAAAAGVPAVTVEQFRRLPWPPALVHIQPGNGRTLVNVPTNVYLEAATRVVPTVLLGQQVQVRATPATYTWSFGDGTTLRTSDPGAPYPDLRTTHVYTRAGTMPVGLTTTYRGEYSVAGGAWLPVDGTADVVTPPADLTVIAARSELVESPLPR